MGKRSEEFESAGFNMGVVKDKIDGVVGKVIPEPWYPTSFAIAAVVGFLFFILTIWGFARNPEEAAAEAAKDARKALVDERDRHDQTREERDEAREARKKAEREKDTATRQLESETAKVVAAEKAKKSLSDEKKELDTKRREAQASLNEANREKKKAEDALRKTEGNVTNLKGQVETLKGELTTLQNAHEDLKVTTKGAKAAFDKIMAAAAKLDTPEAKVETMRRMRNASTAELEGTDFMPRLDKAIKRQEDAVEDKKAEAKRQARSEAKETYDEAMRKLKMAADYDEEVAILTTAKDELAGTDYEVNIDREMKKRTLAHEKKSAKAVYEAVMKEIDASPDDFKEDVEALKVALEQVKGTGYEGKLESMIKKKEKTLDTDIAKAALDEVTTAVKNAPEDYDENIALAEAALPKTEGTKYQKTLKKKLEGLQAARLAKIGKEAYEAARALLKDSPKDYAGNVATLRDLKAKAEGSTYEAKIAKFLASQEKKLARQR